MATPEQASTADSLKANLSLGTSVLLFAYLALAVLKQSDAELVLPSSTFDLGGLLDRFKDGIPGGTFVTPILQVKVPLYLFYTLSPLALVALHSVLVFHPRLLREAAPPLRFTAIWLPPFTLALIMWRFSPYIAARPEPPPWTGRAMEALQTTALAADSVLVILALFHVGADRSEEEGNAPLRGSGDFLRAGRHAGIIWLIGLLLYDLWRVPIALPLAAALVTVWLAEGWFVRIRDWAPLARRWYIPTIVYEGGPRHAWAALDCFCFSRARGSASTGPRARSLRRKPCSEGTYGNHDGRSCCGIS